MTAAKEKERKSLELFPREEEEEEMTVRLLLVGIFLVILTKNYGQPSDRIRPGNLNRAVNSMEEYTKQQYRLARSREISPTFMQSRHFHPDQLARDNRELNQPSSFTAQISSSYYYSYGGPGTNLAISSQEGCRLTAHYCSRDYQCCSGKCRCVKWSSTGEMSCWKKCF